MTRRCSWPAARSGHPPPLRRSRTRQIDPYTAHLTARVERGVLNATKLYAEIQRQGYPGGVALRFARVRRYRDDKSPEEADTIDTVRAMLAGGSPASPGG